MNVSKVMYQDPMGSLSTTLLYPINSIKTALDDLCHKVTHVFQTLIGKTQITYNQVADGLYQSRFLILYLAAASIVAIHDLPLFMGAACVGSIFALVQTQAFPVQMVPDSKSSDDLFKNRMLIQSAFSFIYVAAQVLSRTNWMTYSNEGAISATLSGCMFGHIATTKIRQILLQT